jgi:glycerol-3-phosphate dehydrogenase
MGGTVRRFTEADLPTTVDLLVIGGGITGAATARDAALRGLSVVLVERDDFAAGTSSRSSKLIHGGLRYLQTYQFRMVHESVRERELMLRLAPHLTPLRPFIYLLYDGYPEGRALLNLGLTFYDAFSRAPLRRWHRMLGRDAVIRHEPHLNRAGLRGGGLYHDALTDDARVVIDTLKAAAEAGALVANHREVTGLIRAGGRVRGAEITDRLTGEHLRIRARVVLNTTGPWADRIRRLEAPSAADSLRPTKGVHLVLRKSDLPLEHAVFLRSPRDGRVVWPIPALDEDHVYVGTTDTDYDGPLDEVVADTEDIDYLLEAANHAVPDAKLDYGHVVGTWAGLRPLIAPPSDVSASSVPREHQITLGPDGMLTIAGGKLTTARVMARQLVDTAVRVLADEHGVRGVPRSRSAEHPLSGGDRAEIFRARRLLADGDLEEAVTRRWLSRYGGNATAVAQLARKRPDGATPLGSTGLTTAEIDYAVQEEMARTVTDLLARRTGTFFWTADGGAHAIEPIAEHLGRILDLTEEQRRRQVAAYLAWVRKNRPRPPGA